MSTYHPNTIKSHFEHPDGFIVINDVLYDIWLHQDNRGVFRMEGTQHHPAFKLPAEIESLVRFAKDLPDDF